MKVISFDLDGTLVDQEFNDLVWYHGIPELYSKKHDISLERARELVSGEYHKLGDQAVEWYDIKYWFRNFGLEGSYLELMNRFRDRVRVYPEVMDVLERLKEEYDLILTSNAAREFIAVEVGATGLEGYFTRVFSATSDFGQVKKTPEFYAEICKAVDISPQRMVHVGDHWEFDYLAPREIGITAFYLGRSGKKEGNFVLRDLRELEVRLNHIPELSTNGGEL
ncbi:MAG: HAD family hydrolase [Deltaproteobacteria bacterium]|nr:MAG: HAD family hydrolase [Deltaproteobacteria bacterium]